MSSKINDINKSEQNAYCTTQMNNNVKNIKHDCNNITNSENKNNISNSAPYEADKGLANEIGEIILRVENLQVGFNTYRGHVHAGCGVSLQVHAGEAVGIVGESGCGKSVTAHAIMGLLPLENSVIEGGSIQLYSSDFDSKKPESYAGELRWNRVSSCSEGNSSCSKGKLQSLELTSLTENEWRQLRGNKISMIFQDPMTSLNPVLTVGYQMIEAIQAHSAISKAEARKEAIHLLEQVGIPNPQQRLHEYPHQFSGGMRQRVMIAMALTCKPELLIADEPTTALDVTIQAQIIDLLAELRDKLHMAIILISHDLGVIASLCSQVNVMYAGQIVETGTAEEIFHNPQHPYTKGLLQSLPRLTDNRNEPLAVIDGQPPDLLFDIKGCGFMPRCPYAMRVCVEHLPQATEIGSIRKNNKNPYINIIKEEVQTCNEHSVKCWLIQAGGAKNG